MSDFDSDQEEFDAWDDIDDESATICCPKCGANLFEDAQYCPNCQEYITPSTSAWDDRQLWWIVLGVAGIVAVVFALALL